MEEEKRGEQQEGKQRNGRDHPYNRWAPNPENSTQPFAFSAENIQNRVSICDLLLDVQQEIYQCISKREHVMRILKHTTKKCKESKHKFDFCSFGFPKKFKKARILLYLEAFWLWKCVAKKTQ